MPEWKPIPFTWEAWVDFLVEWYDNTWPEYRFGQAVFNRFGCINGKDYFYSQLDDKQIGLEVWKYWDKELGNANSHHEYHLWQQEQPGYITRRIK